MRLRPYRETDFEYVEKWIGDERTHAMWCANLMPYPLTRKALSEFIAKNESQWGDCGYVFTDDAGCPKGFFIFSVNVDDNSGFAKCIVVDSSIRGMGYGAQMLQMLLKNAFTIADVSVVRLNVFDSNPRAMHCYKKVGFEEEVFMADVLQFGDESWGRTRMIARRD